MNRNKLTFSYPVSAILVGIKRRIAFHKDRRAFYAHQMDVWEEALNEKGVTISRHIGNTSNTTYSAPEIVVDEEIVRNFRQANNGEERHRRELVEYHRWEWILERQGKDAVVNLDAEDVEFFLKLPGEGGEGSWEDDDGDGDEGT